jgi:glycosyltransferase involved in cell wall biosynthesis
MLYNLIAHMEGFQQTVISLTEPGVMGERIAALGIPVFYLCMKRGIPNPVGLVKLVQLIRRQRPQIVQTWLYHGDLMGLLGGKLAGVPVILWNVRQSGMEMAQYKRLSQLVVKTLVVLSRIPTAVVVNSQAGQVAHAALGYHPRRWIHIPNGFDLTHFRPDPDARQRLHDELGMSQESILIGLIARYDPMKGHATFVQAALKLLKTHADVHFALAGPEADWENVALVKPIREAGKEPSFHLLGKREDTPQLLAALDICTSASWFGEGFSNSIGEAMASGVPCVVTDVGDSAWIVGDTGLVVPPRDATALVSAWEGVLDLIARKKLAQAARARMEAEFDIRLIARRYDAVYREYAN